MTFEEMRVDLSDILTEWISCRSEDICCKCCMNKPEYDINYSSCPADFDMFSCELSQEDLSVMIDEVVDRVITALPEPMDESDI